MFAHEPATAYPAKNCSACQLLCYRFLLLMPWKCPACSTLLRPQLTAAGHDAPQPGRVYTCAICRLELVLGDDRITMVVAPLDVESKSKNTLN